MRFCKKLSKLRKDNNLSQEQLAERLGVSRQAVSKWESGSAYPDMDKMIQMCKILNCTLEDLLDDGTINSNQNSKNNANNYFQDFLKFVTKIYNMFCSMTLKQKVKCLCELFIIFLVLLILGAIIFSITESLIIDLFLKIPNIGNFFYLIISNLLRIILIAIGIIIFIHLFKIRYLDYYITVEDENVHEKTIEEPIDKPKETYYKEKKREKVIIRDPKHSSFRFFNFLLKIFMLSLKIFIAFLSIFAVASFIFLMILLLISMCHYGYGILFVWISLTLIGCIIINYNILEVVYKFIVSKKQRVRRIFITSIIGLALIGGGIGLSFSNIMSFDYVTSFDDKDYVTSYEEINFNDYTKLNFHTADVKYVINNDIDNIKLEIKHFKYTDYYLSEYDHDIYISYDLNFKDSYKLVLEDLKNKTLRDYSECNYISITVILSQDNYNKLDK